MNVIHNKHEQQLVSHSQQNTLQLTLDQQGGSKKYIYTLEEQKELQTNLKHFQTSVIGPLSNKLMMQITLAKHPTPGRPKL